MDLSAILPDAAGMRSMTGYGRGEQSAGGFRIEVEVKAVNRKQAEVQLNLPSELDLLEPLVRDVVHAAVSRGRVEVRARLGLPEGAAAARINHALAGVYAAELLRLGQALGPGVTAVSMDAILRLPGVLEPAAESAGLVLTCTPLMEGALRVALAQLDQMRGREGAALSADLQQRIELMRAAVTRIAAHAPGVVVRHREALLQRIQSAGLPGVSAEDERVLKEVVLFADRCDIEEELTRLRSHFVQFDDCCGAKESVGRKLDFLAQEMNREINTIGAKANDALIASEVVRLKIELERFREQVQNVE